jgi:hypothetical protein
VFFSVLAQDDARPNTAYGKSTPNATKASADQDRLEGLARYEVHLDRKLERMLAMLLRLKDLRQGTVEG